MIFDGDLKFYLLIWNIYGVCDICNCFDKMELIFKEYILWIVLSDYKEWEEGYF